MLPPLTRRWTSPSGRQGSAARPQAVARICPTCSRARSSSLSIQAPRSRSRSFREKASPSSASRGCSMRERAKRACSPQPTCGDSLPYQVHLTPTSAIFCATWELSHASRTSTPTQMPSRARQALRSPRCGSRTRGIRPLSRTHPTWRAAWAPSSPSTPQTSSGRGPARR